MAAKSYEAGYKKYYSDVVNVTHSTTQEEIKDVYDNCAGRYDKQVQAARAVFHKPLAECLDAAIKQVFKDKPKEEIKIIDAGAGTGLVGVELDKLGYTNLYAMDISQEMLNEAKTKNVYKKFICAPLSDQLIPEIKTGEFDAVICIGTLVKGHARPSALVELVRMVKIDGLICFNMRFSELDDFQEMMLELEKTGRWTLFSKKTVPYFEADDMPKEILAFVYKVLKK